MGDHHVISLGNKMKKQDNLKNYFSKDAISGSDLWTDGLICAFEYVRGRRKTPLSKSGSKALLVNSQDLKIKHVNTNNLLESAKFIEIGDDGFGPVYDQKDIKDHQTGCSQAVEVHVETHWVPIGWARILEIVQTVQIDAGWASQPIEFTDDENHLTVADVAAPYWERPAGPTWWCHVTPGHQFVDAWLSSAQWLHPAISIALRDESRLISDRMKHLLYEVPVRVAGGLLFELLGQSAGDPFIDEDDIPIVLRSWQEQNYLITAMHVKGSASSINVLGITEVQELLASGGTNAPRTVHEVIAQLVSRLSRWDDRLFRKNIFGAADEVELKFMNRNQKNVKTDEVELKFMNRRNHEDLNLFSVILNQEIRRMSRQVIRVKWSLHAREEIVFELLQHLRIPAARSLLEGVRKNTREMIEEQEAVRGRLFTIQDVMQSTVRAWLQVGSNTALAPGEDK
ncbi:hypothetical protein GIB67_024095 [Kingdonia uniflora]|uniref:Magnesium transporter CorA-like family protein n=1 Tax=Kingdonia uniflora TaxID=39325 RepID=A0A7J7MME5_9MAGN|nr:hypothetical protein GIB67_024095 [Kingdonia uniflora]